MTYLTDIQLIEAIKRGGAARERALRQVYTDIECRRRVIALVKDNRGTRQEGEDMFHEGIIVLDRNVRTDKFRGESTLRAYLYSICRFLWMNQLRKNQRMDYTDANYLLDGTEEQTPELTFLSTEQQTLINDLLHRLSDRCREILRLWQLSYSMEEIAERTGLSSAAMARKNRYRCHKSLMKLLRDNPRLLQQIQ